jgi:RNA recognition motif-containing protein
MRIYVGNLPYDVSEDELKQQFSTFGSVTDVSIPKDKDSGRSKGFGFIEMPNKSEADAAVAGMNSKPFKDRTLTVSEARPREERTGGGEGYGGGAGGRRPTRRY